MIDEYTDDYWIFVIPAKTDARKVPMLIDEQKRLASVDEEYLQHSGKWLIFDDGKILDELAVKINPYVENGLIPSAKYGRYPQRGKTPVMCVFCNDRERDKVWEILSKLGIKRKIWKYNMDTLAGRYSDKTGRT